MATICAVMVERFAREQLAVAKSSLSAKEASEHLQNYESSLTFAVYHLGTMTKQLRKKYYDKADI